MVQLVQIGNTPNINKKQYIVDTTTEMNAIADAEFGDIALNLEDAKFYVLNGSGTWVALGE